MNRPLPCDEKKNRRLSFWNRLLGLSKKSNLKGTSEESFKKKNSLYSSFHGTKQTPQDDTIFPAEETENFVTLECSAFMDMHKDAGILFLNRNSVVNCAASKEESRHVQFAPTPMNKCYKIDSKAASSKQENKENMEENSTVKLPRSILRMDKHHKTWLQKGISRNSESNAETKLVYVTQADGPELKTFSIPRTSTKIALLDRKNLSLPQLNISNIAKYGSLPQNTKIAGEKPNYSDTKADSEFGYLNTKKQFDSGNNQHSQKSEKATAERKWYRQSMHSLNRHSYFGVPDSSRILEQHGTLQKCNNQQMANRMSLGWPQTEMKNLQEFRRPILRNGVLQTQTRTWISQPSLPKQTVHAGIKTNSSRAQYNKETMFPVPDKAINEIGLPTVLTSKAGASSVPNRATRLRSQHYIALSETYSNKPDCLQNPPFASNNYVSKNEPTTKNSEIQKSYNSQELKTEKKLYGNDFALCNRKPRAVEMNASEFAFMSETRRHAVKLAMHVQRRKAVNKMCKYTSNQTEEGFSSMADDECSFNCSCPSCVTKLSRLSRRSNAKKLLAYAKDKYICPEKSNPIQMEEREIESISEKEESVVGKLSTSITHKAELTTCKTLYECKNLPYQTSGNSEMNLKNSDTNPQNIFPHSDEKNVPQNISVSPMNEIVDNIYENLTQILNSATKKQFKAQDVKRILSSPLCSPISLKIISTDADIHEPSENCAVWKSCTPEQSSKRSVTPPLLNDSILLLQEIFQKLSQECKELLQPNVSSSSGYHTASDISANSPAVSNTYVNNLIRNLQTKELSEGEFANIIGSIAQHIFLETKAKRSANRLLQSRSLPDLQKIDHPEDKKIQTAMSLKHISDPQEASGNEPLECEKKSNALTSNSVIKTENSVKSDKVLGSRHLPDGWSGTPTTESSSNELTKMSSSGTDKEDSKCSEGESQLLEYAIKLGMGLNPGEKVRKRITSVTSPVKATKFKSKDVLSGKGKLKLKIYYNSGLVTVHVIRAAKLNLVNGKELNSYVKVSTIPDDSNRVHWRTAVKKTQKSPVFGQKFSFEVFEEDSEKRLVFSVWHRDYAKQRSELIGCMSFSIRRIMGNSHKIDGWYRLLREKFGTQKHFAANASNNCSFKHIA